MQTNISTTPKSIIIVDDEPDMCMTLSLVIEEKGYITNSFYSGEELLEELPKFLQNGAPNLILLDRKMAPKMDGIQVLKYLHTENIKIPVIVITGHGDIDSAVQAMKYGAYDFLSKPFDSDTLIHRIEQAIQKAEFKHEIEDLKSRLEWRADQLAKANSQLAAERDLLHSLMDNIPDTIYFKDKNSRFTKINMAQAKVLGLKSPEEGTGKSDFDFFTKEHAQSAYEDEQNIMTTGTPLITKTEQIRTASGDFRWVSATKVPIKDHQGKIVGLVGISRDITESKKAEEALAESEKRYRGLAKELDDANNMKDLLLDIVTHDLKNPVNVIQGMSVMMYEERSDDEVVALIKESCDNLLKVVDNAATLAKISLGEEIEMIEADLSQILKDIAKEYSFALGNVGMNLELKLAKNLPVQVNPIISEIFKNYLSNALKYASEGKRIIVEAHEKGKYAWVGVRDFGNTIPKEISKKIFERSFQIVKNKRAGRGLGLAIVQRLAEAHQGEVWVEPNQPTGNCFCFKMPLMTKKGGKP